MCKSWIVFLKISRTLVASPQCGTIKQFEIDDEKKLVQLNDKRLAQEFDGEILDDKWKGYVFKIVGVPFLFVNYYFNLQLNPGGCDKQGFPMKQGVLVNSRVKLLLKGGTVGCRKWRVRSGERRRKTIRGCIVSQDIALLNLKIVTEVCKTFQNLSNDFSAPGRGKNRGPD